MAVAVAVTRCPVPVASSVMRGDGVAVAGAREREP